jgi:hypothetical protein
MSETNGAMTPAEQLQDGGRTLIELGHFIVNADALRTAALIDWAQLAGFAIETIFSAAEGAGFKHNEIAPAMKNAIEQNRITMKVGADE